MYFLYTSEKVNLVCSHRSLFAFITIKCLDFTIFLTSDDVGDTKFHHLPPANFIPHLDRVQKILKFRHLMVLE